MNPQSSIYFLFFYNVLKKGKRRRKRKQKNQKQKNYKKQKRKRINKVQGEQLVEILLECRAKIVIVLDVILHDHVSFLFMETFYKKTSLQKIK
jgi:hypothetical protein